MGIIGFSETISTFIFVSFVSFVSFVDMYFYKPR
jgi:hypothetical protein